MAGALPEDLSFLNETPVETDDTIRHRTNRHPCRDFNKRRCSRGVDCRFHHTYVYCHNYQNRRGCEHDPCRYLHVPAADQLHYERTGEVSERLRAEVSRTFQREADVCWDFLNGMCNRSSSCRFRHMDMQQAGDVKCPICFMRIVAGDLRGFANCPHIVCRDCTGHLLDNHWGEVDCPVCRVPSRLVSLV